MEDGKNEGRGLAGAGLGQSQDIPAFHGWRDGLFLNGGRIGVAYRFNSGQDSRVKGKLLEAH